MPAITEITYDNYTIKAGFLEGEYIARAFDKSRKMPGAFMEATANSEDQAIEALKQLLSEQPLQAGSERRWDNSISMFVPTLIEFVTALERVPMNDGEWTMLRAHSRAGSYGMTATEIANAAGYANFGTANALYGKVGTKLGEYMKVDFPPAGKSRGEDLKTAALATKGDRREDGAWVWVMHAELNEALGHFA